MNTYPPNRVINPALHGCEAYAFAPEDRAHLRKQLQTYPAFSVHAPLFHTSTYPGPPSTSYLLDPDPTLRAATLTMLQETITTAAEWGARYVVVHFNGLHSDGLTPDEITSLALEAGRQIDTWATQVGIEAHLEFAGYNPAFHRPEDFIRVVENFPSLGICLDVGHLRIAAQRYHRDEWADAERLAPYVRSMHLWTLRTEDDTRRYRHIPVHPSLRPEDGWIDIPRMLTLVLQHNPNCAIVFEPHYHFTEDPKWIAEGIAWVRELVNPFRTIA